MQMAQAIDDRDVIRPNAMGKFTDLLAAATKSQAMLTYLDGRENRVHKPGDKPNENHARELLELHTLGVNGGYSQNDVMEVARCLSGWRIGRGLFQNGKVQFEPGLHDSGKKLVLGQAIPGRKGMDGRKDLDDVLRIVAFHTSTARHIAIKLCRRSSTTNRRPRHRCHCDQIFPIPWQHKGVLRTLFTLKRFAATAVASSSNQCIRSRRHSGDRCGNRCWPAAAQLLTRMGHMPFEYPSPDGYEDAADAWQGTLLWRWNFAARLGRGQIKGTHLNRSRLAKHSGGLAKVAAHILNRKPSVEELAAVEASDNPVGLLLASPGFQWS